VLAVSRSCRSWVEVGPVGGRIRRAAGLFRERGRLKIGCRPPRGNLRTTVAVFPAGSRYLMYR
jgi:hypothetical protein